VGIREVGGTTVLGGSGEKVWLATCWSVFLLVGVSGAIYGETSGERMSLAFLLIVSCILLARTVRIQVRAEPDRLVIRGLLRTRRLSWGQVQSAAVVPTNALGIFGIVEVTDQGGRQVKADGVGNWLPLRELDRLPVSRMAAVINSRASA
jgi:hypothetical protein